MQSLINSNVWSQNKNISEYGGFTIASYIPPMDSFVLPIVVDDGILVYRPITIWRDLLQFCRAWTLQSLSNSNCWSGFSIASYTPPIPIPMDSHMSHVHSFDIQIVKDVGILLCNCYWKRAITFLYSLDNSLNYQ
jgi:hypothetical protein